MCKTEFMGEENIKGAWTGGRARNMRNMNYTGIEGAGLRSGIVADVTEKRWE
jgi:hypothetical protein